MEKKENVKHLPFLIPFGWINESKRIADEIDESIYHDDQQNNAETAVDLRHQLTNEDVILLPIF